MTREHAIAEQQRIVAEEAAERETDQESWPFLRCMGASDWVMEEVLIMLEERSACQ